MRFIIYPKSKNKVSGGFFVIDQYLENLNINKRKTKIIKKSNIISIMKEFFKYKNKYNSIYLISPLDLGYSFIFYILGCKIIYLSQANDAIIIASLIKDRLIILPYKNLLKLIKGIIKFLLIPVKIIIVNSEYVKKIYRQNAKKVYKIKLWTREEHYIRGLKNIRNKIIFNIDKEPNISFVGFMFRKNYWKGSRNIKYLEELMHKDCLPFKTFTQIPKYFLDNKYNDNTKYLAKNNLIYNVSEFYENIDIYVCTSDKEGFCLPIYEALLYGCIIVSTYQPAIYDYLPKGTENNGIFMLKNVIRDNDSLLQKELTKLIAQSQEFKRNQNKYMRYLNKLKKWNKDEKHYFKLPYIIN